MTTAAETIPVAVRRRRDDGTPELFFYSTGKYAELTCYASMGQHSSASVDYMRRETVPANPADEDCAALLAEWNSMPGATARVVRRLTPES